MEKDRVYQCIMGNILKLNIASFKKVHVSESWSDRLILAASSPGLAWTVAAIKTAQFCVKAVQQKNKLRSSKSIQELEIDLEFRWCYFLIG